MNVSQVLNENRDAIIASYQAGMSTVALGDQYGCSNASVYVFLRDNGVELRKIANKYDDLIPQALERISKGDSLGSVSKDLGIPRSTLQRAAKKDGQDTTKHIKRCEVRLDDHSDDIINLYKSGNSQSIIAERYGCDESNISRALKRHGVETRFQYECDHTFFDIINTESKAYTLGFFVADGYNHKDAVVSIRIVDEDVLLKIKSATRYTGLIRTVGPPKKYPHWQVKYELDIASRQMSEALTQLGCPTKKTFVTRFPTSDEVKDDLLVHYIRGVFDGDGSIYQCKNGWFTGIAGTVALLEPMRDHIFANTGVMFGIYPQGKIYNMKIGGNLQVPRFMDWLYKDATIYMDRKYNKYLEMIGLLKDEVRSPTGPDCVSNPPPIGRRPAGPKGQGGVAAMGA